MYSLPKWSKHLKQLLLKGLECSLQTKQIHELNIVNALLTLLQGLFFKKKPVHCNMNRLLYASIIWQDAALLQVIPLMFLRHFQLRQHVVHNVSYDALRHCSLLSLTPR